MTMAEKVRHHQLRCAPHLARLQMLAGGPGGAPLRPCAVLQIAEVTAAILGEVTTAGAILVAGRQHRPSAALLATRLTRLENAARQMIVSVQRGDSAALREQIYRFDVLTAAVWTVQLSECEKSRRPVFMTRATAVAGGATAVSPRAPRRAPRSRPAPRSRRACSPPRGAAR